MIRIFDAGKGFEPVTNLLNFTDCTIVKRDNRWWMFTAGLIKSRAVASPREITLFSASLPERAPLSATGWKISVDPNDPTTAVALVGKSKSHLWDGK
ncbi:MAG: hypothetical protein ACRECH_13070, partial [Nitrososphaerales archaeon]